MAQSLSLISPVFFIIFLLLTGLIYVSATDPYIRREHRRIIFIIAVLCLALTAQNLLDYRLTLGAPHTLFRTLVSVFGYSVRPAIPALFLSVVDRKGKRWLRWLLVGVNAAISCTAFFSGICFYIDEANLFHRGPLGYTCHIVSSVLLAALAWRSVGNYGGQSKRDIVIPLSVAVIILLSFVYDTLNSISVPVSLLTIAAACGALFYYIWLHLQFVKEHERDLMATQRIQIMMTQIQPHFLFNALNTIRALYAKDPPLADKILEDFSAYLRQNLESLSQTELIPISRELEHTRLYTEIEMLRFPGVRVEYRIGDEHFEVPALTIQPLVENAIRHGVHSRKDGRVLVSTSCESGVHRITVEDNGAGFDPDRQAPPGETHIGLKNVKDRVEQMCGGTMDLKSEIGKGTRVTLLIPDAFQKRKKEQRK